MSIDTEEPVSEIIELKRLDTHRIWRVLLWGTSATLAMAIVAGTALSDFGAERLKTALTSVIEPTQTVRAVAISPQQAAELETQTRQLAQAVRELTADRDRLKGRLAILEQNLDDITGTIKRQAAQKAPPAPPQELAKAPAAPPPAIAAPSTVVAAASPPSIPSVATPTAAADQAADAPPSISPPIPLPPTRLANVAPAVAAAPDAATEPAPVATKEIGVDLGGAATIEALRAHWAALKANVGPDLVGLRPAMIVRQKTSGPPDYRLVVGPFPTSAAAIRLCTKLAASRIVCRAGIFSVQQFAER